MVKKIEHYPELVDHRAKFVNAYRLFAMRMQISTNAGYRMNRDDFGSLS